ncbi:hypothetical protein H696_03517 [Fonticula alba]|uniref:Uncharacterized protein n=1 Tax=Fonticula alba TaxID=691883 RepID=A0A058Z6Z9_FONAL|nr:hypothetical protein H696_03517 [Fonticula alba]KCV70054.1 hypothetical protein H696_03517 [Fonticula alba]|eukprot:XP_009495660.1 hypothetical protein H696_03517 [Fonticula alba]
MAFLDAGARPPGVTSAMLHRVTVSSEPLAKLGLLPTWASLRMPDEETAKPRSLRRFAFASRPTYEFTCTPELGLIQVRANSLLPFTEADIQVLVYGRQLAVTVTGKPIIFGTLFSRIKAGACRWSVSSGGLLSSFYLELITEGSADWPVLLIPGRANALDPHSRYLHAKRRGPKAGRRSMHLAAMQGHIWALDIVLRRDLTKSSDHMSATEFQDFLALLDVAADSGSLVACLTLGLLHLQGHPHLPASPARALPFLEACTRQGETGEAEAGPLSPVLRMASEHRRFLALAHILTGAIYEAGVDGLERDVGQARAHFLAATVSKPIASQMRNTCFHMVAHLADSPTREEDLQAWREDPLAGGQAVVFESPMPIGAPLALACLLLPAPERLMVALKDTVLARVSAAAADHPAGLLPRLSPETLDQASQLLARSVYRSPAGAPPAGDLLSSMGPTAPPARSPWLAGGAILGAVVAPTPSDPLAALSLLYGGDASFRKKRPAIMAEFAPLSKYDGSATYSCAGTTVTVAISGPVEAKSNLPGQGLIELGAGGPGGGPMMLDISVRDSLSNSSPADKMLEDIIRRSVGPVLLSTGVNQMLQVTVHVVSIGPKVYPAAAGDGPAARTISAGSTAGLAQADHAAQVSAPVPLSVIAAAVNAVFLAALDAGLPMRSSLAACSVSMIPGLGWIADEALGQSVLGASDLDADAEAASDFLFVFTCRDGHIDPDQAGPLLVEALAFSPSFTAATAGFSTESYRTAHELAKARCHETHSLVRQALAQRLASTDNVLSEALAAASVRDSK